ncbi:hypothetical protein HY003_01390 [Candidatus Saccharibacteria bacterium]|nr:hypothetical protein [Candidatus Saccharibacteria bacterium]MBI3337932.1 hypothetical protein [Candidatus Saccharibacteria bacterium]
MDFLTQKLLYLAAAIPCPADNPSVDGFETGLPSTCADSNALRSILQIVFGVIAVTTVIFIIISAIRYSTSIGNPQATEKIRNSIVFAAIGLAIAMSAEIIVTFVLGRV